MDRYIDQRNEAVQYTKPYALGSYDMRVKDEWVVMRDATNLKYFYNPLTMYMQWKQPNGTILCQMCSKKFANRFDNTFAPSQKAKASLCEGNRTTLTLIDFLLFYLLTLRAIICLVNTLECWKERHEHVVAVRERLDLTWKDLSGGMENAQENLEHIDLFPDHSEAEFGLVDMSGVDDGSSADSAEVRWSMFLCCTLLYLHHIKLSNSLFTRR